MPLFYNHQSDEEITIKQQIVELATWIEHLEFIGIEINHLEKLKKELVINNILTFELIQKNEKNEILLSQLYDYSNKIDNSIECMDVACDMYYVNQHEVFRNQYLNFIREYRALKIEVFS